MKIVRKKGDYNIFIFIKLSVNNCFNKNKII